MNEPILSWNFEVFFDGECPLCRREIAMLRRMDRHGRILFTDLAGAGFDATVTGRTMDDLMARIHGRTSSGEWVEGVEVFRRLYGELGWRRVVWFTRLPVVSGFLDVMYRFFARNRLRFTGRCARQGCEIGRVR